MTQCYMQGCELDLKYLGRSALLACPLHGTRGANPDMAASASPAPRADRPIPDPLFDLEEDACRADGR